MPHWVSERGVRVAGRVNWLGLKYPTEYGVTEARDLRFVSSEGGIDEIMKEILDGQIEG